MRNLWHSNYLPAVKRRNPIMSCHDKKWNKIEMVFVAFVLQKQLELRQLCLRYYCCGCGLGLCGVGSFVSEMVFMGWPEFWRCGGDNHGGRVLTALCEIFFCMLWAWKKSCISRTVYCTVHTLLKLVQLKIVFSVELIPWLQMVAFWCSPLYDTTIV